MVENQHDNEIPTIHGYIERILTLTADPKVGGKLFRFISKNL
jgi:hypothetical protein